MLCVMQRQVDKDGVAEAGTPVKNIALTGGGHKQAEEKDDNITAENIAENCAKALASLKGRREVERLERVLC
ncbi:hypothetical protein Pmar_PMAR013315 [Perkinsus marinus ATCC 50983]|uniref:Uncharacterized protein n=1 Tax=Perkinsus marinus (strain ATCC 50983 / TXsc) TaxID=423536 RepID=C5LVH5_PERM5|nr:hypothetical protein Pmar_PMAR013315 [Perkinsus marinus ATCC 50983]EEQ99262.1 hypothetical protein Pmar_PMAR013315 [Perkinsus marinus ATCC 50983]|eukprot:XP_002766545.1 hypothetical protein Pmar_PMAR013315 [Perkinsus marinus ATCC 50983]